jgi:hypothetical protein
MWVESEIPWCLLDRNNHLWGHDLLEKQGVSFHQQVFVLASPIFSAGYLSYYWT